MYLGQRCYNMLMKPPQFAPLKPKIVLGVAAHPDDLDFGASGSLAKYAAAGAQVYYLLLTDGGKGSADRSISTEELIKIRQTEQTAAVKAIGGAGVEFLAYPDGMLEVTMDVKRDIVKAIRTLKPDVVVTMDPSVLFSAERGFINHPDHRAAGQATLDAVFPLARDHLSFPELYKAGYEPHKVSTVLLVNFTHSNYYEDITNTLDTKFAALAAHVSQIGDMEGVRKRFTEMSGQTGAKAGCKYAEGFVRLDVTS
jgi:LmbE family N-acetylglucosaminyl deacetylase